MLLLRPLALLIALSAAAAESPVLLLRDRSLNSENFIIKANDSDLSDFSGIRDYYTLLVLTSTDPRHECELCVILENVVAKVSRSYFRDHFASNVVFFAEVDIADRTNIPLFDQLQMNNVPHVWLVPPSYRLGRAESDNESWEDKLHILKQPHLEFKLPVVVENAQVMAMAQWLAEAIQKPIHVEAAEAGAYYFVRNFALTFLAILVVKKRGPRALTNAGKKPVYTILVIAAVLIFTSGYHYTTLERVPFVAQDDNHNFVYISGGSHYQLGVETVIVASNYLALAAATLALIYLGSMNIETSRLIHTERARSASVAVCAIGVFVLYSCLTSIVLRKDHDYPCAFLKLF